MTPTGPAAKILAISTFIFVLMALPVRADDTDLPASHSITPCLYATGFEYADGLVIDDKGTLFVSNYRGNGRIGRILADGTASVLCDLCSVASVNDRPVLPGGLTLDRHGRLIVADLGVGRLLRVSSDGSTIEVLADRCGGVRFGQVDDVAVDPKWNIYFTDSNGSSLRSPVGSVMRYDIVAGQVSQIATGFANPSGLAVSPDGKLLAVAERDHFRLVLYDLKPDGRATNRRVLIAFPTETVEPIIGGTFGPTGLMFDGQGHIFAAMGAGGLINVVDLETGELVRQYDAGGKKVTNLFLIDGWLFTTIASKEAVFRLDLSGQDRHCGLNMNSDEDALTEKSSENETTDEASSVTEESPEVEANHADVNRSNEEPIAKPENSTDETNENFVDSETDDQASTSNEASSPSDDTATTEATENGDPEPHHDDSDSAEPAAETTSGPTDSPASEPPAVDTPDESTSENGIDAILDEKTLRSHLPNDPALYDSLHEALQRESE